MLFLEGHRNAVRSVAWSPTGHTLASGGDDCTVRVWRLLPEQVTHAWRGHTRNVYAVEFVRDGESLISAGGDGHVRLWSVSTGLMRTTPNVHHRSVNCLAIHPRGGVATGDGAWRTASRIVVRRLRLRRQEIHGVSLRNSGQLLTLSNQEASSLAFSPDGRTLAVGTPWALFLWSPQRKAVQTQRFGAMQAGAWSPVEATATGVLMLAADGGWYRSVAFSPEGHYLAAAADSQVHVWECIVPTSVPSGWASISLTRHFTLSDHKGIVYAVAFSPRSRLLATASEDGTACLWSVIDGAQRAKFRWDIGPIYSLAFSPDGASLAAGGYSRIVVWDVDEYD